MAVYSELCGSMGGHEGDVQTVRWTPDGSYCLTGGVDKTIRLWNPRKELLIRSFKAVHNQDVTCLATFKDNSQFFSAGGDKVCFLWDVTAGGPKRKLVGHDRRIHSCAVLKNEELILTASSDKTVRAWDLRSHRGGAVQVLRHATDAVLSLAILNEHSFAAGSADGTVRTYDVRRGVVSNDILNSPVSNLNVSADSNCIIASTLDSSISLLEREGGEVLSVYTGHSNKNFPLGAALDPSDSFVAAGSEDGRLCFWDLVSGDMLKSVPAHGKKVVHDLQFHEKRERLLTCGGDGDIRIWKIPGTT